MKYTKKEILNVIKNKHFPSYAELEDYLDAKEDVESLIEDGYIKKESAYVELTNKGIDCSNGYEEWY